MENLLGKAKAKPPIESNEHGFAREQYPFYLMLEKELGELLDKETLRRFVYITTGVIQVQAVVEWTHKEDVKREMRKTLKKDLRAMKCPSDKLDYLSQQMITLAIVH